MNYDLAKKARLKGFPSMTRLYCGYHTVIGTYSALERIFREKMQLHIEIILIKDNANIIFYNGVVRDTNNLKRIFTAQNVDYDQVRLQLMNMILDKLPDKKGIKM